MKERILSIGRESVRVKEEFLTAGADALEKAVKVLCDTLSKGKKVLVFGNGGSAADSQHLAGELVGRFKLERSALPCVAITTDTSVITAWANDYDFASLFARQVEALAQDGDAVIGISTSGNSLSVINGIEAAKKRGARTIGMSGRTGGRLGQLCEVCLCAPSDETPRIQECHELAIHIMCELIETELFGKSDLG